jgi:ketosteroid isomerase-like protein
MVESHKQLLEQFYTSFSRKASEEMIKCYHPDLCFEDPAFGELNYFDTGMMWQMLCDSQRDKDFNVSFKNVKVQGNGGSLIWEAKYDFRTGRRVHNVIEARFKFKDGLIVDHRDHFNLYKWSKMALGIKGILLGWTSFFKKGLHKQTHHMLNKYKKSNELRK